MGALVFHPGQLTAEFRDGQRARSIAPWRLACNVVAFFLALSFVTNFRVANVADQDPSGVLAATIDEVAARTRVDKDVIVERLDRRFNAIYTVLVGLSVGCYAVLARLTHLRRRERWSIHIVLALHFVAWTFIVNLLYYLAMRLFGISAPFFVSVSDDSSPGYASLALLALILLWQIGYLSIAYRRVYADPWFGAGAKAALSIAVGIAGDNAIALLSFWLAAATLV